MNQILNSVTSLSQYFSAVGSQSLFPALKSKQQQIAVIYLIALSAIGFFIVMISHFKRRPQSFSAQFPRKPNPIASSIPIVNHKPPIDSNLAPSPSHTTISHSASAASLPQNQSSQVNAAQSSIPSIHPSFQRYNAPLPSSHISHPQVPGSHSSHFQTISLDQLEDEIDALFETVKLEESCLASIDDQEGFDLQNIAYDGKFERKNEIIDNIKALENKIDAILITYPQKVKEYLIQQFSGLHKKDHHATYDHLVKLSGLIDKNQHRVTFVHDCFCAMESFLATSVFTSQTELCLQETKKTDFIVFHEFLSIADKHLGLIDQKDPALCLKLKLKLANLPLRDQAGSAVSRQDRFPNIYVSEADQAAILSVHFQQEEDQLVSEAISVISSKKLQTQDLNKIAKMVSDDRSYLSDQNKIKIKNEIVKILGRQIQGSSKSIYTLLDDKINQQKFLGYSTGYSTGYSNGYPHFHQGSGFVVSPAIDKLYRASKAKQFFFKQRVLPENFIQVPRWYHTTPRLLKIIESAQIKVAHEKAYKGAWVSTQIERGGYGDSVLVFNHRISRLDDGKVFIGYEAGGGTVSNGVRWRGLQCPIPLVDYTSSYVTLIGIPKLKLKTDKQLILNKLKLVNATPTVMSTDQVDYMQKEIIKTIGNPNLNESWWGKADVNSLDKIF
ncbi:MAG: hypothetical protein ACH350_03845 [Parachlamydiaceae bacterium]